MNGNNRGNGNGGNGGMKAPVWTPKTYVVFDAAHPERAAGFPQNFMEDRKRFFEERQHHIQTMN